MTDRELLELAAKAAGISASWQHLPDADYDAEHDGMWLNGERTPDNNTHWNPLRCDGDAIRLAAKLRINILFSGGFYHVGTSHHIMDICRLGGMDEIRHEIVVVAAEIGKAMP